MNVPIREFKARLSQYLRAANAGKDIVVTSRGRAVARIVPVVEEKPDRPLSREELRAKIKALMPDVRLGKGKFTLGTFRPVKLKLGSKTMSETAIEGRR
jgi:prevent-host-death family protein